MEQIGINNLLEEEKKLKRAAASYRIFISHSWQDREAVTAFVELLECLGLTEKDIFCSSVPGYGIPLGKDIYEFLREELSGDLIYGVYFLSENYYNSAACLNEMGALWVLRSEYLSMILPGFSFSKVKGAVNPNRIAINLNGDCRDRLNDLKEELEQRFKLTPVSWNRWERGRDRYMENIEIIRNRKVSAEE